MSENMPDNVRLHFKEKTMKIYRAWVNQPSTLQPLHHLHGKHCIAQDSQEPTVRLWFTEGDTHSMQAPRECISQIRLSK